jgi:hypothetical protein
MNQNFQYDDQTGFFLPVNGENSNLIAFEYPLSIVFVCSGFIVNLSVCLFGLFSFCSRLISDLVFNFMLVFSLKIKSVKFMTNWLCRHIRVSEGWSLRYYLWSNRILCLFSAERDFAFRTIERFCAQRRHKSSWINKFQRNERNKKDNKIVHQTACATRYTKIQLLARSQHAVGCESRNGLKRAGLSLCGT